MNMKASIKFTWNKKLKDYLLRRVVASYSGRSIVFLRPDGHVLRIIIPVLGLGLRRKFES